MQNADDTVRVDAIENIDDFESQDELLKQLFQLFRTMRFFYILHIVLQIYQFGV